MIPPTTKFADFVDQIRNKFGLVNDFKVKMMDEEKDLVTMSDQDDLDMCVEAARLVAKKEQAEMGKMNVSPSRLFDKRVLIKGRFGYKNFYDERIPFWEHMLGRILINKRLASEAMHCHDLVAFVLYNIPLPTCSFLSSHTVFPEHEHTVLSLSHTPALLAMTPTRVSGSSLLKGPSCFLETTILRPIISQICIGLSRNTEPIPLLFTVTVPKTPLALSGLDSFLARTRSQMPPVDSAPCEISPDSRTVA